MAAAQHCRFCRNRSSRFQQVCCPVRRLDGGIQLAALLRQRIYLAAQCTDIYCRDAADLGSVRLDAVVATVSRTLECASSTSRRASASVSNCPPAR